MSTTITVSHNAETAHRIPGLTGTGAKCSNVHGHSFWITWTFRSTIGDLSPGAEFGSIKAVLRSWVDDNLDHGFVCRHDDTVGAFLDESGHKVLFLDGHPTTEHLAQVLGHVALDLVDLPLVEVHVQETRVNAATWTPEEDDK